MAETHQLSYASHAMGACPICQTRPVWKKMLYGHLVCKKCLYRFTNRRQVAFLIDLALYFVAITALLSLSDSYFPTVDLSASDHQLMGVVYAIVFSSLFILKDGFAGHSPGKWICHVRVLDDTTNQPVGFRQSLTRNAVLLIALTPIWGGLLFWIILLFIGGTLAKGQRLGDGLAKTRVIWKRYAYNPVFAGNANNCTECGYSLQGNVSGVCPECGTPTSPATNPPLTSAV